MKKATDFTMAVMEKKQILDILTDLMERLDRLDEDARLEWRATGEQEQRTRWNDSTGNCDPVFMDEDGKQTFEDTGKPWMVDKYDNLPKIEYSKEDEARLAAIEKVRQTLASLA